MGKGERLLRNGLGTGNGEVGGAGPRPPNHSRAILYLAWSNYAHGSVLGEIPYRQRTGTRTRTIKFCPRNPDPWLWESAFSLPTIRDCTIEKRIVNRSHREWS